ncbi:MAG: group III truncated hemoglobin [Bacteroidota bacterium]
MDVRDIETRSDIEFMVDSFYRKVQNDTVIGYFFNEVVELDWQKHIPTMYDFWETTLLNNIKYKGNPMKVHLSLHQKSQLEPHHFDKWLKLFRETVDEHFAGSKAELAKTRALSIATVMQIKIHQLNPE